MECECTQVKALNGKPFRIGKSKGYFVMFPFMETEAWPHATILGMAKAHV